MIKKLFLLLFIFGFLGLFMFGCDKPEVEKKVEDITITKNGKTEYQVGEKFDVTGFEVTIKYEDGEEKVIALTEEMCGGITEAFDNPDTSYLIPVKYGGISIYISGIKCIDEIEKMEIKEYGEVNFSSENPLDLKDYEFLITYKSGKTEVISGDNKDIKANITEFEENEDSYDQEVTIYYKNKVNVKVVIHVLSEWDYEDYIDEKVINDLLAKLTKECEEKIPEETTENIELPKIENYDYRFRFMWTSTNTKVISQGGVVAPREEDEEVGLSLDVYRVGSSELLKHYDFSVRVPGLGPVEFEDLSNKKIVMAYFYEGTFREMPARDGDRIDIMCYCFGRVDNGKLSITGLGKLNTVMKWRRDYKMRILLSIGGGASGGFSAAVKDDSSRKKFVDSIMDVIKEYGFDGIDMDWEYPGWTGLEDSTPYDVANFSLLLRDLRAAMDEYKSGLLLTAAVISSSTDKFYQPKELNKYLDYVNIMTYDGNNSSIATHHTKPLGSGYSAKNAIDMWIAAGVAPEKIIVGAAFYGKISELTNPVSNPEDALGKATSSISTITYTSIYNNYMMDSKYIECYDPQSGAYYLSDGKIFITYDNPQSIQKKVELVSQYNLGGMMFWDYGSDSTGQLLSAVYRGISGLNE